MIRTAALALVVGIGGGIVAAGAEAPAEQTASREAAPDLKGSLDDGNKTEAAKKVGALVAKICLSKKIDKVVFDRNGYLYHGRVSALADAAREGGLKF